MADSLRAQLGESPTHMAVLCDSHLSRRVRRSCSSAQMKLKKEKPKNPKIPWNGKVNEKFVPHLSTKTETLRKVLDKDCCGIEPQRGSEHLMRNPMMGCRRWRTIHRRITMRGMMRETKWANSMAMRRVQGCGVRRI